MHLSGEATPSIQVRCAEVAGGGGFDEEMGTGRERDSLEVDLGQFSYLFGRALMTACNRRNGNPDHDHHSSLT